MKSKQTAIEWLVKQVNSDCLNSTFIRQDLIEQAKAMEKEQIVEAHLKGYLEEMPNPSASHYYKDMAEQYYKETFKSE